MANKRRAFTAEDKVAILRRHLLDGVAVSDLCDEYGLNPTVFYRWQKAFFENGAAAFESRKGGDARERRLEQVIEALSAKLAHKDEVIGEIMADHVRLKKSLGEAGALATEARWRTLMNVRGIVAGADLRDEVIDYVREWSEKTGLPATRLVDGLGIGRSKYYEWRRRYGRVNEHNAWVPRDHWLEDWEKEAIIAYSLDHRDDGYRRLTYMMIDEDIVAASPSSVYRVLKRAGLLGRWNRTPSKKGTGFQEPLKPHEHWHTDISYINIRGTFYYLCSILDGFSRYIVHWEIRESMREAEVEIVLQRARERFPEAEPRIISDNGPQFIAKDFKEFIRLSGMTHVRTSPFYPQSNGKQERWHATLKRDCIRPGTPLSLEDARRIVANFVKRYNRVRLHSGIGYIAPKDKLQGRAETILADREKKLAAAREARKERRRARILTERKEERKLPVAGETDASSAGAQLARDSRPGRRAFLSACAAPAPQRGRQGHAQAGVMGVCSTRAPSPWLASTNAQRSPMPRKTPGSGAEPQNLVNGETSEGPESLISVRRLSNSR